MRVRRLSPIVIGAALVVGCSQSAGTPVPSTATPKASVPSSVATADPTAIASASPTPSPEPVLLAAGDIGDCTYEGAALTGAILADHPDATIAAIGDLAYPTATAEQLDACFDPHWGPFIDRMRPALGNHDLDADGGAPFYDMFGSTVGTAGEGWYSYEIGTWHAVVLNLNCDYTSCDADSPQLAWLVADMAASDAECTVAYFHNPRFTSGPHGDDPRLDPFWRIMDDAGVDLVLNAHDHHYERFTPMNADGAPTADGIRQFIAGTGGAIVRPTVRVAPGSEVIIDDAWGVLRLELGIGSYGWSFLTVGGTVADEGTGECH